MTEPQIRAAVLWHLADGPGSPVAIRRAIERQGVEGDRVRTVVAKMLDRGEVGCDSKLNLYIKRSP